MRRLTRLWPVAGYMKRPASGGGGGGPPDATLLASTYGDIQITSATASFSVGSTGVASGGTDSSNPSAASYSWLIEGTAGLFELVVDNVTGDGFSTGAAGTFSLATTRTFTRTATSIGSIKFVTARFRIQLASNPGVYLADETITLYAERISDGGGGDGQPE